MRRSVLALGLVIALAGCGSSSHSISADDVRGFVLRQQDVGRPFDSFYSGPPTQLDTQGTPRSDPRRFGREAGWLARYHRPGSAATRGPLVVESRVDVFKETGGARDDLAAYRHALAVGAPRPSRPLDVAKLGDEAIGLTFVQPGAKPLRFYRLAWRYRNATASITAEGFEGNLTARDAVALARKQQRLLGRA
ncbi:MAG: hypothetical protein ACJ77E_21180 [Gaiellaceae bacterium]